MHTELQGEVTEGNQREVIAFEGPQKMSYILWLGRASVTVEMYFPRIKENVSSCTGSGAHGCGLFGPDGGCSDGSPEDWPIWTLRLPL